MKSLNDLGGFCDHLIRVYGSPRASTEEQKAEEFRRVYLRDLPINLRVLRAVASCFGVQLEGLDKMPRNVRGYHEICGDRKYLYYRQDDTTSGIQNTILHEMREMMETLFAEADPGYEPLRTRARHIAANGFASAVLLPEEEFRARVYKTGFDVIALARAYSKSCSQVLLRMGEVLQGRLFFYGALYESDDADGKEWAVTYWTGSCNDDVESNAYGIDGLFPRKGRQALPGSLVNTAVLAQRSQFVRRISIADHLDCDGSGLAAIAKPQIRNGTEVEKVALIVLLARDIHLFEPQIESSKPTILDDFHRHL